MNNIITERLLIVPMTYSMVNCILKGTINGKYSILEELGFYTDRMWPRQDTLDILNFIVDSMDKNDAVSGFDAWMVVKKEDMTIIGDAGFRGEPNEKGEIEIGFGLIEEEHRKGYGYETAMALIEWAAQINDVKVIKADCLIDNKGSIRILEKCNMQEVSRDKEFIYWEKVVRS